MTETRIKRHSEWMRVAEFTVIFTFYSSKEFNSPSVNGNHA